MENLLVFEQCVLRPVKFQEEVCQEFSRRNRLARRDRMLVHRVLAVSRGARQLQGGPPVQLILGQPDV